MSPEKHVFLFSWAFIGRLPYRAGWARGVIFHWPCVCVEGDSQVDTVSFRNLLGGWWEESWGGDVVLHWRCHWRGVVGGAWRGAGAVRCRTLPRVASRGER